MAYQNDGRKFELVYYTLDVARSHSGVQTFRGLRRFALRAGAIATTRCVLAK